MKEKNYRVPILYLNPANIPRSTTVYSLDYRQLKIKDSAQAGNEKELRQFESER
jgi:hypothetical protein